jgi:hypothetical protein
MNKLDKIFNSIKAKKLSKRKVQKIIDRVHKKQEDILSRKYISQKDLEKEITI